MTKKFTKALLIAVCALTLVAATFAGTLAYLTAETTPIVNTFTAGNVSITLTETNYVESYKLVPGKTYTKDPTVTVTAGSERCYLFVDINNGIATIEADGSAAITAQLAANDRWAKVYPADDNSNVWYYTEVVDASGEAKKVETFTYFAINGKAKAEDLAAIGDKKITITAYAVQAEGFDTAAAAWGATFGAPVQP